MATQLELAAERRIRQGIKRLRDWQRSLMDCGGDGCGECRVCRHYEFMEWVSMVAPRDEPYTVSPDPDVVLYLKSKGKPIG